MPVRRPPVDSPAYQEGFNAGVAAAVAALREMARVEWRRARQHAISAAATAVEDGLEPSFIPDLPAESA